jgi:hypothetical protein
VRLTTVLRPPTSAECSLAVRRGAVVSVKDAAKPHAAISPSNTTVARAEGPYVQCASFNGRSLLPRAEPESPDVVGSHRFSSSPERRSRPGTRGARGRSCGSARTRSTCCAPLLPPEYSAQPPTDPCSAQPLASAAVTACRSAASALPPQYCAAAALPLQWRAVQSPPRCFL